jgi:hypothetical protein
MMITGPFRSCVALGNLRTGYGYEAVREAATRGRLRRLGPEPWLGAPATGLTYYRRPQLCGLTDVRRPGPDDTRGLSSSCYS